MKKGASVAIGSRTLEGRRERRSFPTEDVESSCAQKENLPAKLFAVFLGVQWQVGSPATPYDTSGIGILPIITKHKHGGTEG